MSQITWGRTTLPDEPTAAYRKARRLEWLSIVVVAGCVSIIMAVMGSSQAMKAAWIEDCLSFLPPIAFLIAQRVARRDPDGKHPWGYHRSVGVGHLASALALLLLGSFVVFEAISTLVTREHPTIGTLHVFGHTFWQGWAMIAALIVTAIPTVLLGRAKMKIAEPLHDKVLYADADMMRADWMTAAGAVVGISLIGLGLWWADAAVALLIGADIVKDGVVNVRNSVVGLMDATARTYDDKQQHPLVQQVEDAAGADPAVAEVCVRMRDMGHVMHTEVFVVPALAMSPAACEELRDRLVALDWKLEDLAVVPVTALPPWR